MAWISADADENPASARSSARARGASRSARADRCDGSASTRGGLPGERVMHRARARFRVHVRVCFLAAQLAEQRDDVRVELAAGLAEKLVDCLRAPARRAVGTVA